MADLVNGKINFLEKKGFLKSLIFEALRLEDDRRICKMLRHLWGDCRLGYNKFGDSKLTNEELVLARILSEQKISANSAYRWFRLSNAPKDMLELAMCNKVSMNSVTRKFHGFRQKPDPEHEREGRSILREIVKVAGVM